jgi:hypothetical protein
MEIFVAGHHELALVRASASALTIHVVAGIYDEPSGIGITLTVDKSSPPGHSTFFVVSAAGAYVALDITAEHDLQFAGRLPARASRVKDGRQRHQHQQHPHQSFLHSRSLVGLVSRYLVNVNLLTDMKGSKFPCKVQEFLPKSA